MIELTCVICSKRYSTKKSFASKSKYCSRYCMGVSQGWGVRVELTCEVCSKKFLVTKGRAEISKHCSRKCHNSAAGIKGGKAGKGKIMPYVPKPHMILRNKLIKYKGKDSGNWKGDNVGYYGLHMWIKSNFGIPTKCENCGAEKSVQWSNKDHKYTRMREDWEQLCSSCHQKYDHRILKGVDIPFDRKNRSVRLIKSLTSLNNTI